jgi:hypothetical protein
MQIRLNASWPSAVLLFAAWMTAIAGCGDSDVPEIVEVSGTVTRGGKPVPNLYVHFFPENGRPSWGQTDENGRYTLEYDADHKGAKVGPHTVFVEYMPEASANINPGEDSSKAVTSPEKKEVIKKYGKAETSPLKVSVTEEGQVIDLALD